MVNRVCLHSLTGEIWRCRIISQLSLQDLCRLDSATLNNATRRSLLESYAGAEILQETIVSTDRIDWIISKNLKALRIKLIEDITERDLFRYIEYCPQLLSLNTWDFAEDAQAVLKKSRQFDDEGMDYSYELLNVNDEVFVIEILQKCKKLKQLSLCEMTPDVWFEIFPILAEHCVHLEAINYHERKVNNEDIALDEVEPVYTTFYIIHTSLQLVTGRSDDSKLFTSIAAHFPTLTSLAITADELHDLHEEGLIDIAEHCTSLQRVLLGVPVLDATLVKFCRLRPTLIELRLLLTEQVVEYELALLAGGGGHY